jgi:hypothetical protein
MLPLNDSIPDTRDRASLGRLSRQVKASAINVGAAAVALFAFTHTSADAAENSTRMAQVQHACTVVMGLEPSGRGYDTCVMSLDRSLSLWDQARMVKSDRTACARKGLQPGTPAFAVCVVQADQSQ